MPWLNPYGLVMVAVILIPNLLFAIKCKDGFENSFHNPAVETLEQIGRFGCFGFMIFTIPGTAQGWTSHSAFVLYLVADAALAAIYCAVWAVCFRKSSLFRALALSILPSILFLVSAILTRSWPLLLSALIFAPCHIWISVQNTRLARRG